MMDYKSYTKALRCFHNMKYSGLFPFFLAILTLAGCAAQGSYRTPEERTAAESIAPGEFFVVEQDRAVAVDKAAFLKLAEDADYILIGEGHPIRCDHEAQATIMRWLAASRTSGPAVALEMVGLDRQGDLDAFLRGELNAGDLREALDWKRTWGHDFFAYGPVFATAEEYQLPLYAANLPPGAAFAYGRGGVDAVAPLHRQYLPRAIIPAGEAQREDLRSVFERHVAMMKARRPGQNATADDTDNATVGAPEAGKPQAPDDTREAGAVNATRDSSTISKQDKTDDAAPADNGTAPVMQTPAPEAASPGPGQANATAHRPDPEAMFHQFITVQSLWDTVMAENAVRVRQLEGSPVVVLAGSGHVENGWGIALRLQSLDPEAKVLLVMPWRADPAVELPPEALGDVFFSCPLPPGARTMGPPPGATDDSETGDAEGSGPGMNEQTPAATPSQTPSSGN